ncbi:hypothetical protein [Deinococcus sedimenti]|uniref:Uncharacterized protein n=1 Tax=Deinococcus sedimenti TaxID=1867090 RepID=A0ABQ2S737_9DEIO|nr:hypothetical protein [Deinococcus sedimenti]GGR93169.1 hypothetical protein GCM10008960_20180 [Deinococcus sedimenti]
MKKILLTATLLVAAAPFTATVAFAQNSQATQQAPTAFDVLSAILRAKGLILTPAQIRAILAQTTPNQLASLAQSLGVTPAALRDLVAVGNSPVPPAVALRAVLEAATGEPVSLEGAQRLIASDPATAQAVSTLSRVAALVNNPVAATQLANRAEVLANQPVTPRGGGN